MCYNALMNKQEIYNYLKEQNIWHEVTEHKAVFNMEELAEVDILMQRIFFYAMTRKEITI